MIFKIKIEKEKEKKFLNIFLLQKGSKDLTYLTGEPETEEEEEDDLSEEEVCPTVVLELPEEM